MQTQLAVAQRALALGLIALRAQAENGVSYCPGEEERFRQLGEDLSGWAKEQKVGDWLSKEEKKLHRKALGKWTHSDIAERFWRIESLKALLWALGYFEEMPTYSRVGNVEDAYSKIPVKADVAPFLNGAHLREEQELELERSRARFFNWRCRTELFRLQGRPPARGDTYEAVVARALAGLAEDGIHVEHDGVDIVVDGGRFQELEGDLKGNMMSVCYERHLALEWVCGEGDWDLARADT
jgi:hypothetical protein